MKGKVKWFNVDKGFGFITDAGGEDHYFNVRGVKGAELPKNGDKVVFDARQGQKGPRASNVVVTEQAEEEKPYDPRIMCPKCYKKIVPRMITYRGTPEKSVCPYCAATVKTFSSSSLGGFIVFFIVVMVLLVGMINT